MVSAIGFGRLPVVAAGGIESQRIKAAGQSLLSGLVGQQWRCQVTAINWNRPGTKEQTPQAQHHQWRYSAGNQGSA